MCTGTILLPPGASACTGAATPSGSLAEAVGNPMTRAGAVALAVRAAIAGPQDLSAAVQRLGATLREQGDVAADRLAMEMETRWQLAAEAAVRVNVEVRILAGRRAPTRPAPIRLAGSTLGAVLDRCEDELRWIGSVRSARRSEALDRHPSGGSDLDALRASRPAWGAVDRRRSDAETEVAYWLDRLDPHAADGDVARVLAAVNRALTRNAPAAIGLGELIRRVNARAARRRQPVLDACTYLEGLLVPGVRISPDLIGALERVADGAGGLTPALRRRALSALGQAERVATHGLILDRLRPALVRADLASCEDIRMLETTGVRR